MAPNPSYNAGKLAPNADTTEACGHGGAFSTGEEKDSSGALMAR